MILICIVTTDTNDNTNTNDDQLFYNSNEFIWILFSVLTSSLVVPYIRDHNKSNTGNMSNMIPIPITSQMKDEISSLPSSLPGL